MQATNLTLAINALMSVKSGKWALSFFYVPQNGSFETLYALSPTIHTLKLINTYQELDCKNDALITTRSQIFNAGNQEELREIQSRVSALRAEIAQLKKVFARRIFNFSRSCVLPLVLPTKIFTQITPFTYLIASASDFSLTMQEASLLLNGKNTDGQNFHHQVQKQYHQEWRDLPLSKKIKAGMLECFKKGHIFHLLGASGLMTLSCLRNNQEDIDEKNYAILANGLSIFSGVMYFGVFATKYYYSRRPSSVQIEEIKEEKATTEPGPRVAAAKGKDKTLCHQKTSSASSYGKFFIQPEDPRTLLRKHTVAKKSWVPSCTML